MRAFLDIETGGFSITKNGICEIALIVVDEQFKVVDSFHTLIKPYTRLDNAGNPSDELVSYKDDAMAVNGLTVERLIEEGTEVIDAMCMMAQFILINNIKTIIGHNSNAFDIPRISYLLNRFTTNFNFEVMSEDTMIIAKNKLKLPSYKLESLCTHFGIEIVDQHTAQGDVLATIELYKNLIK